MLDVLLSACGLCETSWTLSSLHCATVMQQPARCHSPSRGKVKMLTTSARLPTGSRAGLCRPAAGGGKKDPMTPLSSRSCPWEGLTRFLSQCTGCFPAPKFSFRGIWVNHVAVKEDLSEICLLLSTGVLPLTSKPELFQLPADSQRPVSPDTALDNTTSTCTVPLGEETKLSTERDKRENRLIQGLSF